MRLSFVALLLSFIAFCSIAANAQGQWVEERPAGAGYRIEFPGTPKSSTQDVDTRAGSVRMYMSEFSTNDDTIFLSIYSIYPENSLSTDTQKALSSARDGGVNNVKGKLRSERRLSVGGAPATRVVIDIPESNQTGVALIVLSGNRLYQAITVVPAGQETSADVMRFIDSFALVSR